MNNKPLCLAGDKYKGICVISSDLEINNPNYEYFGNTYTGGDMFADYCPIPVGYSIDGYYYGSSCTFGSDGTTSPSMYEYLGDDSGCFISNLIKNKPGFTTTINTVSICYKYECDDVNLNVIVYVEQNKIICPTNGSEMTLDGFSGHITCPPYNQLCLMTAQCYDIIDCIQKKSREKSFNDSKTSTSSETTTSAIAESTSTTSITTETSSYIDTSNTSSTTVSTTASTDISRSDVNTSSTEISTSANTDISKSDVNTSSTAITETSASTIISKSAASNITSTTTTSVNTDSTKSSTDTIPNTPIKEATKENNSNIEINTKSSNKSFINSFILGISYSFMSFLIILL